jgi:hypothetical protein
VAVKNAAQGNAAMYIIGGMLEDSNRVMTNTQEDPLNTINMGWGTTDNMLTASILADLTEDLTTDPTADLTNPMDIDPMDNGPTEIDKVMLPRHQIRGKIKRHLIRGRTLQNLM